MALLEVKNLISGALRPDSGEILFDGKMIQGMKPYQIAIMGLARTFQHVKLFSKMTALENVMIGRHIHSKAEFFSAMMNLPWTWREEKEIVDRSLEIMSFLGIEKMAHLEATSLAYGQQRAVELARAIACRRSHREDTGEGDNGAGGGSRHVSRDGDLRRGRRAQLRGENRR
jgi:branched-chain amino acid transport system ATP-binding protein